LIVAILLQHQNPTRSERLGLCPPTTDEFSRLAATEKAACLRTIQRYKIAREDQAELEVRRL
jgi:hypothetical protein